MAIIAFRSRRIPPMSQLTMSVAQVCLNDTGVANGTINFIYDSGAGTIMTESRPGMTLGAGYATMDRRMGFKRIDKQGNRLPVPHHGQIGLAVALETLLIGNALFIQDPPDAMRRMAIDTHRNLVRFFLPKFTADNLAMYLLDLTVAFLAGAGNVVSMNAGKGVSVVADVMSSVTVDAHGRHHQALLIKANSVNTLGIVGQDAVFRDIVLAGNRGAFLMATAAHERDIELGHSRVGMVGANNIVSAVTIPALRSELLPLFHQLAVHTGHVGNSTSIRSWWQSIQSISP